MCKSINCINQSITIYITPLQDPYSEGLLTQAKWNRSLQKLVKRRTGTIWEMHQIRGKPNQVVGPTTEKGWLCDVAERVNGNTKSPRKGDQCTVACIKKRERERESGKTRADGRTPSQISTTT